MSADSFAKIDMSLDDIIKLNKKEKKKATLAEQKKSPAKGLTAAQRKRAETLKKNAKLNKLKRGQQTRNQGGSTTTRRGPRFKTNPATKVTNLRRKTKAGLTRGGKINNAKQQQINAASKFGPKSRQRNRQPGLQQRNRQTQSPKTTARPSIQDRLGVRIDRTRNNQRNKRQQVMNKNRQGLTVSRTVTGNQNAGRNSSRGRSNRGKKNAVGQTRNRQYNQQPRGNTRQQVPRGTPVNRRRQNNQQRNTSSFFSNQGNTNRRGGNTNKRGRGNRGAAKNQRRVTLV